MKISGSYTLDAPRQQVWDALNDIEVLARIVPGCQRLEQVGENEYEGTLKIGVQAIKGIYNGRIRIEDIQAPHHYRLVAKGRSSNGVVDGSGVIDLADQDGKTVLNYDGDAEIGGTLASVGQRLIEGASRQLINQSLKALAEQIAARANGSGGAKLSDEQRGRTEPDVEHPASVGQESHLPTVDNVIAASAAPEADQPALAIPASTEVPAGIDGQTTTPVQPPEPPQSPLRPTLERRTVVVPAHEQLQPATVVSGMITDFIGERPWVPWVVVAFLLGFILGRSRSS